MAEPPYCSPYYSSRIEAGTEDRIGYDRMDGWMDGWVHFGRTRTWLACKWLGTGTTQGKTNTEGSAAPHK